MSENSAGAVASVYLATAQLTFTSLDVSKLEYICPCFTPLCRQYETGECTRSGFCNFMHLKPISRKLRHELYGRSGNRGGGADFGRGDRLVGINLVAASILFLICGNVVS